MATRTYDLSGNGGLAVKFEGDRTRAQSEPQLRYKGADGQYVAGIFNPFKKDGYLSPANQSYKQVTPTGTILAYATVPRVFVYHSALSTPETYMLAGDRFWQASGDSFTTLSSDATDINDGNEIFPADMVMYYLNGQSAYPFFLTGDGSFSTVELRYYDAGADTYTSVANSKVGDEYASLVVADNGYMYVLANNHVDKFDGTEAGGSSGTYTNNVLEFPSPITTRGGIDYRGLMYIGIVGFESDTTKAGSHRNNERTKTNPRRFVGVYVWDRLTTAVRMRDFYELYNAQDITGFHISPAGTLRVFILTTNRTTQLLEYTGTGGKFNVVQEMGATAYPSQPKGVGVGGMITYWLGQDGYFYAFGKSNFLEKECLVRLLDMDAVAAAITGTSTDTMTLAGAILVTGYYNTGQADTANRLDHEAVLIGFQHTGGVATTFTVTIASPGVFTSNSHGLVSGDSITLSTTGALPTGLATNTTYYVISSGLTANEFQLSATLGGSAINTSGSQSGTHSFRRTSTNQVIRYFPHTSEILQSVTPYPNEGNAYTKVDFFKGLATLHHLNVYCAPVSGSGSTVIGNIKLYANQSTTAFKTVQVTRDMAARGYVSIEINKPYVNAFQIEIEWSTSQALGTNDFTPSFAVLEYDDASTTLLSR